MGQNFTDKTFDYFDKAKKNRKNKTWFEKNTALYDEHVREPFAHLLRMVDFEFSGDLPKVEINPKKISQPTYRSNKIPQDGSVIKTQSHVFLAEKATSMYEWNPGIYLSIGAEEDNNVFGLGLYMMSGRQIKFLRRKLADSFDEARPVLEDPKLKKHWGVLEGEKYVRFPKDYDENEAYSKYLWHKQFFFNQHLTRKTITSKNFHQKVMKDLRAAMPFMQWVREAVGTYK